MAIKKLLTSPSLDQTAASVQSHENESEQKIDPLVNLFVSLNSPHEGLGQKRLLNVAKVLFVGFLIISGILTLLVNTFIHPFFHSPNLTKRFDTFENPSSDIIKNTVPFVQGWFSSIVKNTSRSSINNEFYLLDNMDAGSGNFWESPNDTSFILKDQNSTLSYIDMYFEEVEDMVPFTSPSYIKLVLQNFGPRIYRSSQVCNALHEYVSSPRDLQPLYKKAKIRFANSIPMVALAVAAKKIIAEPDVSDFDASVIFEYSVHFYVVLEALSECMENDLYLLSVASEALFTSRKDDAKLHYESLLGNDEIKLGFYLRKYRTVAHALKSVVHSMTGNIVDPYTTSLLKQYASSLLNDTESHLAMP